MCIGQDPVLVTPLQMAVVTAAMANGGKVLWPRWWTHRAARPGLGTPRSILPRSPGARPTGSKPAHSANPARSDAGRHGRCRWHGQRAAPLPGLRICGKTGTAQVKNERGKTGHTVWFASFAPFEKPRYAVVVMVEGGLSGGVPARRWPTRFTRRSSNGTNKANRPKPSQKRIENHV